jgi:cob(I)alamin adenosyltransferase
MLTHEHARYLVGLRGLPARSSDGTANGAAAAVPRSLHPMAVHLTKIYTRTGDDGTSGLGDFSRVAKTDPRLAAYADVEETNCAIGVALAMGSLEERLVTVLRQVQNDLFDVGADLCNPIVENPQYPPLRIDEGYVTRLEGWCDEFNTELPKLDSFILPGGTPGAALLHTARVVARRAERSTWLVLQHDAERTNALTARYLNRLSDLLFILCRVANPDGDVLWHPGGRRDEP